MKSYIIIHIYSCVLLQVSIGCSYDEVPESLTFNLKMKMKSFLLYVMRGENLIKVVHNMLLKCPLKKDALQILKALVNIFWNCLFSFFWFIHYFELCDTCIILDLIWIIYIHIHIHTYTCECRCTNVELVQVFQRNYNAVLWRHTRRPTQMLARARHSFPEHKRNPNKQFHFTRFQGSHVTTHQAHKNICRIDNN